MQESGASKVLGILAIVLGVVGLLCCPYIIALAGLVCGIIGLVLAKQPGDRKLCIIGVIVASLGLVGGIVIQILLFVFMDDSGATLSPFVYAL